MTTTIAEQVSRLAETMAAQPPNEIMGAFIREQADLAARGRSSWGDGGGRRRCPTPSCSTLTGRRPASTRRSATGCRSWCSTGAPGARTATSRSNTYQRELVPELAGRGVGLVAISPQAPDGSLSIQEKNELTFSVLSDPGNQVAKAAGILTAPSDEARAAQLQLGLDLTVVNADGTTGLPCPPRSSSTPNASSAGSTSTPTTPPAPSPARSWPLSTP